MTLGDRLRELRRQHAMTLVEISRTTGLSVSYLSDLERSRTTPSLDTLERLAACYRITTTDMLANVDGWGMPSPEGLAPGLDELVRDNTIEMDIAQELNRIQFRGKRPQTKDEWHELFLHLRRIMKPYLPPDGAQRKG